MSTPQTKTWEETSAIRTTGSIPFYLTGHLVQVIRQHFGDRRHIHDNTLHDNIWTPDTDSKLMIDWSLKLNPKMVEQRPAILIERGDCKPVHRLMSDGAAAGGAVGNLGGEQYRQQMVGEHNVTVLCVLPAEAEIMAQETFESLTQFGPIIRCDFNLLRFRTTVIGKPEMHKEFAQHFAVDIGLEYGWWNAWEIIEEELPLKTLDLRTQTA